MLCFVTVFQATWAWAAFQYETREEENVTRILEAYAQWRGQSVEFSSGLTDGDGGTLSGTFTFETGEQFLSFLSRNKKIVSYTSSDSIYFCLRTEMESVLFSLQGTSVSSLRNRLRSLGVYDTRYPLRTSGSRLFRITAPEPYVAVISQIVEDMSSEIEKKKATRVFKLKHAWAEDITIENMNESVTVAGVARLLRELTGSGGISGASPKSIPAVRRVRSAGSKPSQSNSSQSDTMQQADKQSMAQGGARILADARLNAVIIWDDAERMPFYQAIIRSLDTPMKLVEIRVAIIDVAVNKTKDLGIAWSGSSNANNNVSVTGGINNTGNMLNTVGDGLNVTTIFTNGMDTLMARVNALEVNGDAHTLSRPAVLTMDNVQASLENVSTFYVDVAGTEVSDLFAIEYGTVMKVTPHIVEDTAGEHLGQRLVKLVVHVESGSSDTQPTSTAVTLPTVNKSIINTQAMVAENQALIIGGHYYETKQETVSGVPLLMHIPLLGQAFRTNSKSKRIVERLFVISPRVVDPRNVAEAPPPHISGAIHVSKQLGIPAIPPPSSGSGCGKQSTYVVR